MALHDPRLVSLRRALEQREAKRLEREADTREAAVLLLLRPREALELLFIKRAQHDQDPWSGHMAFPGGRRDPDDDDLLTTARRETVEETGIDLSSAGEVLGRLDEVRPTTMRLPPLVIAPYVAGVSPETDAAPDPREVEAALWIPLEALRDGGAGSRILLELEGAPRSLPSLRYRDYVIWGLTHRILLQLLELAESCGI
ncbi:MAG: CoA pyrophosphatase [Gemmatimonadetes bacterium]|nr:CoA pyrophosphatase [Gemmatimonadota bacterium]